MGNGSSVPRKFSSSFDDRGYHHQCCTRPDRKFSRIGYNYQTSDQEPSFNQKSLHQVGNVQNPYEQAITIIGKALSSFDEDNLIPCFGFGDDNMSKSIDYSRKEAEFALSALMEIPSQYLATINNILGRPSDWESSKKSCALAIILAGQLLQVVGQTDS